MTKKLVRVQNLGHLYRLAEEKKAIALPTQHGWCGHQGYVPAAWAINWSGQMIHRLLPSMRVYEPKEKRRAKSTEAAE